MLNNNPHQIDNITGIEHPKYDIGILIGEGGMGKVFRAHDRDLKRAVAIKFLRDDLIADAEVKQRFIESFHTEAVNNAKLAHPNIVHVNNCGSLGGKLFIEMELLEGEPLNKRLQHGPLPLNQTIPIVIQTLEALDYAHQLGVIHRDIKPANIFLSNLDKVKVLDFGISTVLGETNSLEIAHGKRLAIGTAQYISPEQAQGIPSTNRTDVYSVGILLYEMVIGNVPFDGITEIEIRTKQVNEPLPPLPKNISIRLRHIIEKALQKDPAQRYQSAEEMKEALQLCLRGYVSKQTRLIRTILAVVGVILIVVLITSILLALNTSHRPSVHIPITASEKESAQQSHKALAAAIDIQNAAGSIKIKKKTKQSLSRDDIVDELTIIGQSTPSTISLCESAIKLDDKNQEAYYAKGIAIFYGEGPQEADTWVASALRRFPDDNDLLKLKKAIETTLSGPSGSTN